MKTQIIKSELSKVNKIGETIWEHTITKDEFYYENSEGKKELHLNALAWESPSIWVDENGEEHRGFVPGDPFYNEIINEFKTFNDKWRTDFKGGVLVRKIIPNSEYDMIISWYSVPKMISWRFCKNYEYSI